MSLSLDGLPGASEFVMDDGESLVAARLMGTHDHVDIDGQTGQILNKHVDGGAPFHREVGCVKNIWRNRQHEANRTEVLIVH